MVRPCLGFMLFVLLASGSVHAQTPAKEAVLADIAAYKLDPLGVREEFARILRFATESPAVRLTLAEDDLPWMAEALEQGAKSLFLSAYIVGNVERQLNDGVAADQKDAGYQMVIYVYRKLKERQPAFRSSAVEALLSGQATLVESSMTAPTSNENARKYYNEGTKQLYANDLAAAEKNFLAALQEDPGYIDALDHLAIVYRRTKRLDLAVQTYQRSLSLRPDNVLALTNLGLVYLDQQKLTEALDSYRQAVALEPENPETHYGLAAALQRGKSFEQSLSSFAEAIRLYEQGGSEYVYDAYYLQGYNLMMLEKYEEALGLFEKAQIRHKKDAQLTGWMEQCRKALAQKAKSAS